LTKKKKEEKKLQLRSKRKKEEIRTSLKEEGWGARGVFFFDGGGKGGTPTSKAGAVFTLFRPEETQAGSSRGKKEKGPAGAPP